MQPNLLAGQADLPSFPAEFRQSIRRFSSNTKWGKTDAVREIERLDEKNSISEVLCSATHL